MRKKPHTTAPAPLAYQLPEREYRALIRARDRLRIFARMGESNALDGDEHEPPLMPRALTQWVDYLADDLDDIVGGAWWPGEKQPV